LVVAIAGPPNAGKSTLLNRLARREAAIVSPHAGTTRDVIEVHLDLGGYPVTLLDTAGIRESDEPVEQEGIRRAAERAVAADLVLWVVDVSANDGEAIECPSSLAGSCVWLVKNKVDIAEAKEREQSVDCCKNGFEFIVSLSAQSGSGLDQLVRELTTYSSRFFGATEAVLVTRGRHRRALDETVSYLDRALAWGATGSEELIAEELRSAATTLGRLTGRIDVEDILDVIFRDFCIGK
jgi:tRNA modification GTPase